MENLVPRERILLCKIKIFIDYDPVLGGLVEKKLSDKEAYRLVIFMDGEIIDFNTGDVIQHINQDDDGYVVGEIYLNTMYIEQLYSIDNKLKESEYTYAQELYQSYLKRKKLIEEGKLLLFQQKRLY